MTSQRGTFARVIRRLHSLKRALAAGRHVQETAAFVRREARKAPETVTYHLRSTGAPVRIRHERNDAWTLYELFGLRAYELPAVVREQLAGIERPRVLDLGGNVGLFAQFAFGELEGATVTSVEPDPRNAEVLTTLQRESGRSDWHVIQAAAGSAPGYASFRADASPQSRLVSSSGGGHGLIDVEVTDALPLLDAADLAKIDIEGGEWALLADPRLATASVRAIALEYHDHLCPGPSPADAAVEFLERAGYAIVDGPRADPRHCGPDVGSLWAVRGAHS